MSDVDETEDAQRKAEANLPLFTLRSSKLSEESFKIVLLIVSEAFTKFPLQKDIAEYIKRQVDLKPELNTLAGKGPWQCIVGKSFASAITHEPDFATFFDLPVYGQTVMLFKSLGVQSN